MVRSLFGVFVAYNFREEIDAAGVVATSGTLAVTAVLHCVLVTFSLRGYVSLYANTHDKNARVRNCTIPASIAK